MAGVKGKSGGKRKGAGAPKIKKTQSEETKAAWILAAQEFAKKHGKTVQEVILDMLVDPDVQDTAKIGVAKLYNEALIIKTTSTESTVSIDDNRPRIYVPKRKPDPALTVVAGGK